MQIKIKDPMRWKDKFAIFPTRIGPQWVWLEPYSVRHVDGEESRKRYPRSVGFRPAWLEEFRYAGQSYWRLSTIMGAFGPISTSWVSVNPIPKRRGVMDTPDIR